MSFAADTGTLQLDNSASFSGTVAGMTGSDTIDFGDIDPAKVQTPSYAGDTSGGTLSVTDGAHSANIALLGNYLASTFTTASDGHGGTAVADPAVLGGVRLARHPRARVARMSEATSGESCPACPGCRADALMRARSLRPHP